MPPHLRGAEESSGPGKRRAPAEWRCIGPLRVAVDRNRVVRLTVLNFRSPVAVIMGILTVCAGLMLLAMPFSISGIGCGTALTPRSIEVDSVSVSPDEPGLLGEIRAQSQCADRVQIRRLAGVPLVLVGIAAIAVGATPRWRRRHRRHRRGRRHRHHRQRSTSEAASRGVSIKADPRVALREEPNPKDVGESCLERPSPGTGS
jgi:hypothetical protein